MSKTAAITPLEEEHERTIHLKHPGFPTQILECRILIPTREKEPIMATVLTRADTSQREKVNTKTLECDGVY